MGCGSWSPPVRIRDRASALHCTRGELRRRRNPGAPARVRSDWVGSRGPSRERFGQAVAVSYLGGFTAGWRDACQSLTSPSGLATASNWPLGLKATSQKLPGRVNASWPVFTSQSLTPNSPRAVARRRPSGLKPTPTIYFEFSLMITDCAPVWGFHFATAPSTRARARESPSTSSVAAVRLSDKAASSWPVAACHTLTLPLAVRERSRTPSGAYITWTTDPADGWRRRICAPVVASQMRTVLSWPPVARWRPSGLKATQYTILTWPRKVSTSAPVATSQIFAVPSSLAVARLRSSGLKARPRTASVWGRHSRTCSAVLVSHTVTVPSAFPRARCSLPALKPIVGAGQACRAGCGPPGLPCSGPKRKPTGVDRRRDACRPG